MCLVAVKLQYFATDPWGKITCFYIYDVNKNSCGGKHTNTYDGKFEAWTKPKFSGYASTEIC